MVFWAIRGYSVSTSPRLDLVSWSPPLEYQVAAGSIATPASSPAALAVGALCWQSRAARAVQLAGPDDRRADEARHRRARQRLGRNLRRVLLVPVGVRRNVGVVARGCGRRRARQAGVPGVRSRPDQAATSCAARRDLGAPGVDNVYGAGELQLPKPPDVVAPTATALVSTGRKGRALKLLSTRLGRLGRGERGRGDQARPQDGRTIKPEWFVSAASPKTVAVAGRCLRMRRAPISTASARSTGPATRARRAARGSSSSSEWAAGGRGHPP